jgi:iron complex transport system substrate-binding protein
MRIVSLLASATEIIAALGCMDQLVGRSHECDYPEQVQQLPLISQVQIDIDTSSAQIDAQVKQLAHRKAQENPALQALSLYDIDIKKLQEVQPDLIFTQTQCDVCAVSEQDVVQALSHIADIQPRIVSLAPYRLQDIWEDIARVGKVLKREEQAEQLIQQYQQRLSRLQEQVKIQRMGNNRPGPRVAILEWLDPLMGAGNWTPELVEIAGGSNVFGRNGEHSPWITWEALYQADPDIIILAPCGFTLKRTQQDIPQLQQHPCWSKLQAVQQNNIYAIDGNAYLNRSGPRLVDSAEILGKILWNIDVQHPLEPRAWQKISVEMA